MKYVITLMVQQYPELRDGDQRELLEVANVSIEEINNLDQVVRAIHRAAYAAASIVEPHYPIAQHAVNGSSDPVAVMEALERDLEAIETAIPDAAPRRKTLSPEQRARISKGVKRANAAKRAAAKAAAKARKNGKAT